MLLLPMFRAVLTKWGFFNLIRMHLINLMGFELFCQEDDMWYYKQIFLGLEEEC